MQKSRSDNITSSGDVTSHLLVIYRDGMQMAKLAINQILRSDFLYYLF